MKFLKYVGGRIELQDTDQSCDGITKEILLYQSSSTQANDTPFPFDVIPETVLSPYDSFLDPIGERRLGVFNDLRARGNTAIYFFEQGYDGVPIYPKAEYSTKKLTPDGDPNPPVVNTINECMIRNLEDLCTNSTQTIGLSLPISWGYGEAYRTSTCAGGCVNNHQIVKNTYTITNITTSPLMSLYYEPKAMSTPLKDPGNFQVYGIPGPGSQANWYLSGRNTLWPALPSNKAEYLRTGGHCFEDACEDTCLKVPSPKYTGYYSIWNPFVPVRDPYPVPIVTNDTRIGKEPEPYYTVVDGSCGQCNDNDCYSLNAAPSLIPPFLTLYAPCSCLPDEFLSDEELSIDINNLPSPLCSNRPFFITQFGITSAPVYLCTDELEKRIKQDPEWDDARKECFAYESTNITKIIDYCGNSKSNPCSTIRKRVTYDGTSVMPIAPTYPMIKRANYDTTGITKRTYSPDTQPDVDVVGSIPPFSWKGYSGWSSHGVPEFYGMGVAADVWVEVQEEPPKPTSSTTTVTMAICQYTKTPCYPLS